VYDPREGPEPKGIPESLACPFCLGVEDLGDAKASPSLGDEPGCLVDSVAVANVAVLQAGAVRVYQNF
jgi:hypothetical protein